MIALVTKKRLIMPHELFNLAGKYIIDFTDISFKTFF